MAEPINLHSVDAFKQILIEDDISLVPLAQIHAEQILKILAKDKTIREKVKVAALMQNSEDVTAEIRRYKSYTGLIRYVLLKHKTPVGMISFWRDDGFWGVENLDDYGFGYFLDPDERGQGLVTRSLEELMDVVNKNLYVRQFVVFCEDQNKDSIALLKKLGFEATEQTFPEPDKGWIERKYVRKV